MIDMEKFVSKKMQKPMAITLLVLVILFGGIFLYKVFVNFMMKRFFASQESPTYTVSTVIAKYEIWKPQIKAVGSSRTTLGVNITAQLGGMIQKNIIYAWRSRYCR